MDPLLLLVVVQGVAADCLCSDVGLQVVEVEGAASSSASSHRHSRAEGRTVMMLPCPPLQDRPCCSSKAPPPLLLLAAMVMEMEVVMVCLGESMGEGVARLATAMGTGQTRGTTPAAAPCA